MNPALDEEQTTELHAAIARYKASGEHIAQFFAYKHLPSELAAVSAPFCRMAVDILVAVPRNPERTVALRKLLEAKDAAVRAVVAS